MYDEACSMNQPPLHSLFGSGLARSEKKSPQLLTSTPVKKKKTLHKLTGMHSTTTHAYSSYQEGRITQILHKKFLKRSCKFQAIYNLMHNQRGLIYP